MNFLAGLLLTYMPNEACAFGGLVVLMQERNLRELYKTDLARLQVGLYSRRVQGISSHKDSKTLRFIQKTSCRLAHAFSREFVTLKHVRYIS